MGRRRRHLDQQADEVSDLSAAAPARPAAHRRAAAVWRWFRSQSALLFPGCLILLAVLAAYANSLHGPFVYDGPPSITDNPTIRHLWPISRVLSPPANGETVSGRPLLNLSFAINYALGGTEVWGYHAVNLAIHLVNALLVFGILRRTLLMPPMNGRFGGAATPLALATALLWALHPLQTESVTYVVQRAESLGALFYLLTLYGVVRGVGSQRAGWWYAGSVLACLLGMATKEVLVTAPVVVLLYDRTFVAGSFIQALRHRWALYLGLAATWALMAYLVVTTGLLGRLPELDVPDARAYAQTQPAVVLHYLRLSFWPHPLCLEYAWPVARSSWEIVPGAIVLGLLLVATAWGLTGGRVWGFLGAWFLLILAPTSSVMPLAQLAFEHRMYLPLAAVVTGVVLGAHAACLWLERCGLLRPPWRKAMGVGLLAVVSLALGILTGVRNADYGTDVSLWKDTVHKAPHNPQAHNNLGIALLNVGRIPEAIEHCNEALRLWPNRAERTKGVAGVHNNLGAALLNAGRIPEAIEQCNKALRLEPDYAEAHNNLGNASAKLGRTPEAVDHYLQALRLKPDYAEAHYNLGNALAKVGRILEAIEHYAEALRLKPDHAGAHNNLSNALVQVGRAPEAIEHYAEALRLKPDYAEAHNNLAGVLLNMGRIPEAIEHYNKALQLKPDFAEAHNNLGAALLNAGRIPEAVDHHLQALQLQPDYAEAHYNLGNALLKLGRTPEAVEHWSQALRLAEASGQVPLVRAVRAQLESYRAGRP